MNSANIDLCISYSWMIGIRFPEGTGIFLFAITPIPALRPPQTPYTLGIGLRRPECEVDQSPLSSVDMPNA
jgi:hypothetical protein